MARAHDLIVWGASGFTGRLVAEHLARHYSGAGAAAPVRWAMAGRDRAKLEAVRAELAATLPAAADVPILTADLSDESGLDAVIGSAKVVLTLAGPYAKHGGAVVASAVRTRTDYADITGASRVTAQSP